MFSQMNFKWSFVLLFAAMLPSTFAAAKTAPGNIAIGENVPTYLGIDLQANDVNANDYLGKVLVVTFWASWCGPCVNELQVLENLQVAAKDNVQVIAVNIEDRDKFRSLARGLKKLTLKLAHDYGSKASNKLGVAV